MSVSVSEDGLLTPNRYALVVFVASVPLYIYTGYILFDDVFFSGIAALLLGGAMYLFVPYLLRVSATDSEQLSPVDVDDVRRATVGIPLYAAGLVAFGGRFVVDGYLVPIVLAALVGVVLYVPTDRLLPGAGEDEVRA